MWLNRLTQTGTDICLCLIGREGWSCDTQWTNLGDLMLVRISSLYHSELTVTLGELVLTLFVPTFISFL